MAPKFKIAALAALIFLLGTGQNLLIAKFVSPSIAAAFFFVQALLIFAVTVGSSTIVIKNFTSLDESTKTFKLHFLIYQIAVTFTLAAASGLYLLYATPVGPLSVGIFVAMCILQANSTIVSFLRLFDRGFIHTQWVRVLALGMKIGVLLVLPLERIDLLHLLLVFATADVLTAVALYILLGAQRKNYELVYQSDGPVRGALAWGSLNGSIRNLPRLFIFFIAQRYGGAQALIDLRLILLPRENLASMMGVVNLVFFKELLKGSQRIIFGVLFIFCMSFQLVMISAMQMFGLGVELSTAVVLFYASASAVYGVTQQHWGIVKENRESLQFLITLTALGSMTLAAAGVGLSGESYHVVNYLTLFNFMWVILIFFAVRFGPGKKVPIVS